MTEDLSLIRLNLLKLDVSILDYLIDERKAELRRMIKPSTDINFISRLDAQINILDDLKAFPARLIKSIEDKLTDTPYHE